MRAIERAARDLARWSGNNLHALDGELGPALREQSGDRAVTATDIEDATSLGGNQRCQRVRKHPTAAAKDEGVMAAGDP